MNLPGYATELAMSSSVVVVAINGALRETGRQLLTLSETWPSKCTEFDKCYVW